MLRRNPAIVVFVSTVVIASGVTGCSSDNDDAADLQTQLEEMTSERDAQQAQLEEMISERDAQQAQLEEMISDRDMVAEVPADVDQAINDYAEAWNTYDGDLFLATTTDDYVMHTERYGDWDQEQQLATVADSVTHDWHSESFGDRIVTGEGPWYVAFLSHLTADMYPEEGITGINTLMVVDDGGDIKIARHTFQAGYVE